MVVLLTNFHQRDPFFGVLLEERLQKVDEIGIITGYNFGIDEIPDDAEIDFCEARIVAECKWIMKRQALEKQHSKSKGVGLIEIKLGGSLSIIKIKLP